MQDSLEGEEEGVCHQVAGEGGGLGLVLREAGQVTQLGVTRHGALGEQRMSVTQGMVTTLTVSLWYSLWVALRTWSQAACTSVEIV